MSKLAVVGARYSVYTRIVLICLEEKGVSYDLSEIDIFDEAAKERHRTLHPFGKIPVLTRDDETVIETGSIVRLLDREFGGHRLFPENTDDLARCDRVIDAVNAYVYPTLVWQVYVPWSRSDPAESGAPDFSEVSVEVDRVLDFLSFSLGGREWLSGRTFGAADAFAISCLAYFMCVPWGRAQMEARPTLARWVERAKSRPSVAGTQFDQETS